MKLEIQLPTKARAFSPDRIKRIEIVKRALLSIARQCWEQGIAAQAMLELGDTEMLALLAKNAVERQSPDGRLCIVELTPAITDPAICAEPVLAAGKLLQDPSFEQAVRKNLDYLLNQAPRAQDGTYFHLIGTQEIWADAAAMSPPFFALMGRPEEAYAQLQGIHGRLHDPDTGLYHHMWSESANALKRGAFWGVGNGWVLVGLLRTILHLPADWGERNERPHLIRQFQSLLSDLLRYQRPDMFFHDVLNDPDTFVESELSEMVAYSIYRAVQNQLLNASWLDIADRIRLAIYEKIDDFGFIQGCAASPHFDRPGTSAEGQAHFLMMEAAARDCGR